MAIIKPISDLRNKSSEISALVHDSQEPVYITRNGEGDMVVMSIQEYRRLQRKLELFEKLAISQAQVDAGAKGTPYQAVLVKARKMINEKKLRG
ncbi:MAG: type II toxin-antitoxin system Phd/YefM family antitoxin [Cyclobacteriaceae bacterium]|jgi:prevent-host-death family protein